jgi:cell division protein FtsW (lipid II flippase)
MPSMRPGNGIPASLPLLTVASAGLLVLGILGIQRGDELTDGIPYAPRQVVWVPMALGAFLFALCVPYRRLRGVSYPLLMVSLVLLVAVFFFPPRNGARRWIPFGPMTFQPSELAKLAYILSLGQYLMFRRNHRTVLGLIPPFLMTVLPVLLILKEPDLGTAMVFFPVLFAMLFVAGARRRHLAAMTCAGLAVLPVLWTVMSAEQKSRVTAVFLQTDDGTPQTGDGYHLHQSKQMLALGGSWGSRVSGMPLSDPAAYRLPAGRTDFVYCLIGERWGLPGTLGVLLLFLLLTGTGLHVAARTRDPFGRLVATGIVSMIGVQAAINTSMTVGLAPITGLTLPLLSYGGTSLVMTCFGLGILGNISRDRGYDLAGQPFQFAD